jgi:DNA-binding response OmpR family regulator
MELLILLIEKDGSVVSREAILNGFSGKDVFVDESVVKYSGSGQSLTFT